MTAALHVERLGAGPDLALIHGWAMHGGVWRGLAERLATSHRVHLVDLPGHGRSAMIDGSYTLEAIADAVAAALPAPAALLGWSLGGLVAMSIALRDPARVTRLVLTGATPRFVNDACWSAGLDAAVVDDFGARLGDDPARTVHRFLALQVRGSDGERQTLARLKAALDGAPPPDPRALAGGLAILRETSLLPALGRLRQPVRLIHGARDTITPPPAAAFLGERLPAAVVYNIDGAGHAPFLSHPERFAALLEGTDHDGRP